MGRRINTIMQTCFFAISGVLPRGGDRPDQGRDSQDLRQEGRGGGREEFRGRRPDAGPPAPGQGAGQVSSDRELPPVVPEEAPDFVHQVTAMMMAGQGDDLPVSALPVDGTYPTGTTQWEKRNISQSVPVWEPDLCIQCGNCSFVCPHSVIRSKFYDAAAAGERAGSLQVGAASTRAAFPRPAIRCRSMSRTAPAAACASRSARAVSTRGSRAARPSTCSRQAPLLRASGRTSPSSTALPDNDRTRVDFSTVRGVQFLQPLFEFSGACAGCGETPYVKLLSQLFGDRLLVANATGCSSIYGGNLPTTPWTKNSEGRGPGLVELAVRGQRRVRSRLPPDAPTSTRAGATSCWPSLRGELGEELVDELLEAQQVRESEIRAQRDRVDRLKEQLAGARRATRHQPAVGGRSPGPP